MSRSLIFSRVGSIRLSAGLTGRETNVNPKTGQPIAVHPLTDTVFELDPPHDVDATEVQADRAARAAGRVKRPAGTPRSLARGARAGAPRAVRDEVLRALGAPFLH